MDSSGGMETTLDKGCFPDLRLRNKLIGDFLISASIG